MNNPGSKYCGNCGKIPGSNIFCHRCEREERHIRVDDILGLVFVIACFGGLWIVIRLVCGF